MNEPATFTTASGKTSLKTILDGGDALRILKRKMDRSDAELIFELGVIIGQATHEERERALLFCTQRDRLANACQAFIDAAGTIDDSTDIEPMWAEPLRIACEAIQEMHKGK